jgi:small GTP-binding protein
VIEKLKICMIGATGVGKTSLTSRFARSAFSDRYRTTIGVAIERKDIRHGDDTTQLVIWDLSGEDEFQNVQPAYLRGAAGYLLVMDGTRAETIDTALVLKARIEAAHGKLPFVVAINKADLAEALDDTRRGDFERLGQEGWVIVRTSAKTGADVDRVFEKLVEVIHGARGQRWN